MATLRVAQVIEIHTYIGKERNRKRKESENEGIGKGRNWRVQIR